MTFVSYLLITITSTNDEQNLNAFAIQKSDGFFILHQKVTESGEIELGYLIEFLVSYLPNGCCICIFNDTRHVLNVQSDS